MPSFNIRSHVAATTGAELFVNAGPMGISFFILDTGNFFSSMIIYSFPVEMPVTELAKETKRILQTEELLQKPYKKTHIFWSFPDSILVPPEFMEAQNNGKMLQLVYGDASDGIIKTDFLYKHNLHNVYRVPAVIHDSLSSRFSLAGHTHQYSLLVDRKTKGDNEIFAVFYTGCFTVMLRKAGMLQVVQTIAYNNPADAAYHLLNICKSFEVSPETVRLDISGMIDEKSNLYAAIYNYFLDIHFDELPGNFSYSEGIKGQPPHFFSHLFALAACV